jgi:gas vesicle protein
MKKSYLSIILSIFVAALFIGCSEKSDNSLEDAAKQIKESSEEVADDVADHSKEAAKEAEEAAEKVADELAN